MKKIYLLIAAIPLILLSSCKEKGPVESPSFSSFGKEISFEAFFEKRSAAPTTNPVVNAATSSESAPSFSYSSKFSSELNTVRSRSGDGGSLTLNDTMIDKNRDTSGSFDSSIRAFAYVEKNKNVTNEKITGGQNSGEEAYTEHINRQYQVGTLNEQEKIYIFNMYLKTYSITDLDGNLFSRISSSHASNDVLSPLSEIPDETTWSRFSDEKKQEYKFYADGKTLTMAINSSVEIEQKEVIDGEEKTVLKSKTDQKKTYQFIFDEKEVKCRYYEESKSSVEKISYYTNRIISETIKTNLVSSFEGNIKVDSKVSLKLEDASSYRPGHDLITESFTV